MGFVLVYNKNWKRVRKNGQLTPYFSTPEGAFNYLIRELGNSQLITIKKV